MWKASNTNASFKWSYLSYLKDECNNQDHQSFYFYPNHSYHFSQIEKDIHRYMNGKIEISSTISKDPTTFIKAETPIDRKDQAMQLYSCLVNMTGDATYQPETERFQTQPMYRSRFYTYSILILLMIFAFIYLYQRQGMNRNISFVLFFLLFFYLISAMIYNKIL
jgi:hypothetical protein